VLIGGTLAALPQVTSGLADTIGATLVRLVGL